MEALDEIRNHREIICMDSIGLWGWAAIALLGLAFIFFAALIIYGSMYQKAGPNEVLIISGRGHTHLEAGDDAKLGFRLVQGGGTIVWPIIEKVDRMSLEMITLDIKTPEFYTKFGVPIQ